MAKIEMEFQYEMERAAQQFELEGDIKCTGTNDIVIQERLRQVIQWAEDKSDDEIKTLIAVAYRLLEHQQSL